MANPHVISSNADTFERDVIENSAERPVLVDFWAEWCAPCRSIAPVLEQLAAELDGRLLVVKIDTDAEQTLAQQYGIRSLPTLLVFRHGEIVEQIIGAQPASAIIAAIGPHLARPGDVVLAEVVEQREAGDLTGALAALETALEADPDDHRLALMQAEIMLDLGDIVGAESVLTQVPVMVATSDAAQRLEARIRISRFAEEHFSDPDERAGASFKNAVQRAIEGEFEEALDELLELIMTKRDWQDGLVRKTILDIFTIMGDDDPRLKTYRTRLARTLN